MGKFDYIHWDSVRETRNGDEIQDQIEKLKKRGFHPIDETAAKNKISSYEISPGVYSISRMGKYRQLWWSEESEFGFDFHYWKASDYKNKEELADQVYPSKCKSVLVETFVKNNGLDLIKAFGTVSYEDFGKNVPKQFYYIDPDFNDEKNVGYIDVTSMFPAKGCGRMPDAKTAIQINGRAEPSEEYPFAYYLNSHHVAEYLVFDTHEYMDLPRKYRNYLIYTGSRRDAQNNKINGVNIYNDIPDQEEITVLMKASEYEMTSTFEELFETRNRNHYAKAVMNKGIGILHRNPENGNMRPHKNGKHYDFYHLAAIILGRANASQIAKIREIEEYDGFILQVIVDSIIYAHADTEMFGISDHILGEYRNEFPGKKINYMGTGKINKYVIYDDDGNILKAAVSGVQNPVINKPEDIYNYN